MVPHLSCQGEYLGEKSEECLTGDVDLGCVWVARSDRHVPWAELDRDLLNAANDFHPREMSVLAEVAVEDVAHQKLQYQWVTSRVNALMWSASV
jgi:hypothetical protein